MKIDTARLYIELLQAAIDQAEAEGRDELQSDDIRPFAAEDDAARAALVEVIERAGK